MLFRLLRSKEQGTNNANRQGAPFGGVVRHVAGNISVVGDARPSPAIVRHRYSSRTDRGIRAVAVVLLGPEMDINRKEIKCDSVCKNIAASPERGVGPFQALGSHWASPSQTVGLAA